MFGKKPLELSPSSLADSSWGVPGLSSIEAKIYACCIAFLVAIRWSSKFASREGVRTLDVGALNRVVASKEIMWAYLNAGVLEPLLTIAGSEDITEKQLIVNCLQLAGCCSCPVATTTPPQSLAATAQAHVLDLSHL